MGEHSRQEVAWQAGVGDRRWRDLLDRHDAAPRSAVTRHGGTLIKTTGDGCSLCRRPRPRDRSGSRVRDEVRAIPLEIRGGVQTGEVERRGGDVGGIGVHIAARVVAAADPVRSWCLEPSATWCGTEVPQVSEGPTELKGIEGRWELFAVAQA